jgi:hypothetical protein
MHDPRNVPVPVDQQNIEAARVKRTLTDEDAITATVVFDSKTLAGRGVVREIRVLPYPMHEFDLRDRVDADGRTSKRRRSQARAAGCQDTPCNVFERDELSSPAHLRSL